MRSLLIRANDARGLEPQVHVDPAQAGWEYVRFEAYKLQSGQALAGDTGGYETGIVVLGGTCDAEAGAQALGELGERRDVWDKKPPHALLLPPGTPYRLRATGDVHFIVAGARTPASQSVSARVIRPDEMAVEVRGEGRTLRHIHHILPPSAESARLILVEVYTPAGNWSSFPPHKHDTEDPPREAYLEEIYYYQVHPAEGFALQRVYTDDASLDLAAAPGDGDVVLVPKGYHPVAAMPGHDCYYLNVMAGPSKAWNFAVDRRYEWLMNWKKPKVAGGDGS